MLAVYVAFIAPRLVSLLFDDFLALLLSRAAVAMVQIILFQIFIYYMIIPISNTLRQEQTGHLEIFLAAPLKPSDVSIDRSLFIEAYTVFVLGLFLLNPPFSTKSSKLGFNILIAVVVSMGLFAASLISLMRVGVQSETIEGTLSVQLLQTGLSWLVGFIFLYLGKRKFSRIE